VRQDAAGNLCVAVPAAEAPERTPTVVIQGHMDMVCEKTPDSAHNFSSDPIRQIVEGDWLRADRTTLGADNGIALALAMELAEDPQLVRPPLELLFTADEESGLIGAKNLDPDLFTGRILLNLDSEEEGIFTVGCAGGTEIRIRRSLAALPLSGDVTVMDLTVGGLRGGHSGVDIDKHRASANKLLARLLQAVQVQSTIRLVAVNGGTVHNAIARDAAARIACDTPAVAAVKALVTAGQTIFANECGALEPSLQLRATPVDGGPAGAAALNPADTAWVVRLLLALPHGVAGMSAAIDGLVESSDNLATVELASGSLTVLTSQRSSVMSRLAELNDRVTSIAALAGADTELENSYPAWEPDMASALLKRCQTVYRDRFGKNPAVRMIHAGLECGIIGSKKPGMDMVSVGPTIENPHSPDERLHIPSIARTWEFLSALLKSYAT
jgi:dipeptidase D